MKCENLDVWKRSCRLSVNIYKLCNNLKDFGFKDQITRSGLSIASNIAEGKGRGTDKECVQFLRIALGSLYELQTQLELALRIEYITEKEFESIDQQMFEVEKMLNSLISSKLRSQ